MFAGKPLLVANCYCEAPAVLVYHINLHTGLFEFNQVIVDINNPTDVEFVDIGGEFPLLAVSCSEGVAFYQYNSTSSQFERSKVHIAEGGGDMSFFYSDSDVSVVLALYDRLVIYTWSNETASFELMADESMFGVVTVVQSFALANKTMIAVSGYNSTIYSWVQASRSWAPVQTLPAKYLQAAAFTFVTATSASEVGRFLILTLGPESLFTPCRHLLAEVFAWNPDS